MATPAEDRIERIRRFVFASAVANLFVALTHNFTRVATDAPLLEIEDEFDFVGIVNQLLELADPLEDPLFDREIDLDEQPEWVEADAYATLLTARMLSMLAAAPTAAFAERADHQVGLAYRALNGPPPVRAAVGGGDA